MWFNGIKLLSQLFDPPQTAESLVSLTASALVAAVLVSCEKGKTSRDVPDQEGPVRVDNADPTFHQRVLDVVEDRWVWVEPLDLDLRKLESFAFLRRQHRPQAQGFSSAWDLASRF